MSDAVSAFGSLLKRGDGASPEVFTAIAEVNDHNFNRTLRTAEVTHHQSTNQGAEFIGTISERNFSLELNFLPGGTGVTPGHDLLENDQKNRTKRNFQFDVPDELGTTKTYSFTALITQFNSGHGVDAKASASVTLQITGDVTWSVA